MNSGACFHCAQVCAVDPDLRVLIDGELRQMCCGGCKAVAGALLAAGHEHYYRVRTEPARTGHELIPEIIRQVRAFDNADVQAQFVERLGDDLNEANLILEGISCAACLWLNEKHLESLPGVEAVRVNYATRRAWLRWHDKQIRLSDILLEIESIGYHALPYDPRLQQQLRSQERRRHLFGLGVAGLFGMQVMMLSISLYTGAWSGMEDNFQQLFRWLSLVLTIPVIGYAAAPFFRAALSDVRNLRAGMDVPVSIALAIAFAASLYATVSNQGEVYFDSVVMFVFLLLLSRLLELSASQRSAESIENLAHALPLMAIKIGDNADSELQVSAASLMPGDRVLIRPGETVPADGEVIAGASAVDESLLSGESRALQKCLGAKLIGGSVNLENPLQMRVQQVGNDTVLSSIARVIELAQSDKPAFSSLADRIASRFVVAVLGIAAVVAIYWWQVDPEACFEITLATLIVSCPCALSLATPTALSAVLGKLHSDGLLVRRASVIETLARVSRVVFDKTGTLSCGMPQLQGFACSPDVSRAECFRIAAALERNSEHPLARAILRECGDRIQVVAQRLNYYPGGGISGEVNAQQYFIGSVDFILRSTGHQVPAGWLAREAGMTASLVVLSSRDRVLALFGFEDALRADAGKLIRDLQAAGYPVALLSGDREAVVAKVAAQLGISDYSAELSPLQKMEHVQQLQSEGEVVLMLGDGINDAPVLAGADVSIAMAEASSLARTSADIVMFANYLERVSGLFRAAAKTRLVIAQNLVWALLYNASAIPAAALGLVPPWLAAIGMSTSSLLVVLNALRLTR